MNLTEAAAGVEQAHAGLGGVVHPHDAHASDQPVRPRRPRATTRALLRAARPRQWVKNLLVLAAPGAAGVLTDPGVAREVALAFVSFCLLSSATYLLNDVRDREQDRRHPRKRARPIAAGELSVRTAVAAAVVLALIGLALAATVTPTLAALGLAYLALTTAYSLWLRRLPIADIATVAATFMLRAVAGGVAAGVPLSGWFVLVASFGALFLVAGKRFAELRAGGRTARTRAALNAYTSVGLRLVLVFAASAATLAYCLWAVQRPENDDIPWYELTAIPFLLWMARYALLLERGEGQAPEELVFSDSLLVLLSVTWAGLFACGLYVGG